MTTPPTIEDAVLGLLDALDESDIDRPARQALTAVLDALHGADTATVHRAVEHAKTVLREHPFIDAADLEN
ncbi:hypothetical protein [Streptomyces sp. CB03911]|uniref:hypothetical protein n=1 Tax=Streptomyces sp. CB03911 TaxID=1804758 RepID=UPI00093D0156|nr:hypothetical protein [Streptomyces sp. CB03911]OKI16555.1 hypothetical protein A6A07_11130 [Streptomyces sp. CB03911]